MSTLPANKLSTEKIGKLIWEYSFPSIVGMVVMSVYNIVDRIFIGHGVGALAISGLALTFPFMILLQAFGMLIGAGAASRISINMGEGNTARAEKVLGNALTLTVIISGSVALLSFLMMDYLLKLFGGTDLTIGYAKDYMQIIIPGSIFSATLYGFNNIMRASGFPRKAMYTMMIGAAVNVILDPIFIFVFDWGIRGAAIATVISFIIGSWWVLIHFNLPVSHIKFRKENFRLEKDIVYSILNIGMSPFSMQLATSIVVILINSTLLKYGGDLAIGAFGIINSLITLIIMVVLGLNQGTQPIVGYNYGAKLYDRMFRTVKLAIIIGTILTTSGFLLGMFFSDFSVGLFTKDNELTRISANALRISIFMFPFVGFQIVISNFFQSIGKARVSIFLSLTRQFIFLIPAILLLPSVFGLNGAWAAMPVSDALATITAAFTYYHFYKNFKRL
ncbi:MAG: MATE family efflux transporter [Paludibacter sp.]|jgi:putative MATE family efflux protein|nr:MATE family efflux transporter [Paludibacter sp.]